jgi:hypothetical protein
MTSDDRRAPNDVPFRQAGVGHGSKWECAACGKGLYSMLGRRLRKIRGAKAWVCKGCGK